MIKEVEPLTAGALLTVPGHSTAEEAINAGAGQELSQISALRNYLEFILIVQENMSFKVVKGTLCRV